MSFVITEPMVRKLVATVDRGLVKGLGDPEPGKMCVEAAISYALGEPHSDGPSCVDPIVRQAKIALNDGPWSGPMARARGMRAVAIGQLGSKDVIDAVKFVRLLSEYVIREVVPIALRAAGTLNPDYAERLNNAADRCAKDGDQSAAYAAARAADAAAYAAADAADAADAAADASDAAYAAAHAAYAAAHAADAEMDRILSLCAALMVRALKECGSPGCDWLWLLDEIPVTDERSEA
jgi:hypothetical protein